MDGLVPYRRPKEGYSLFRVPTHNRKTPPIKLGIEPHQKCCLLPPLIWDVWEAIPGGLAHSGYSICSSSQDGLREKEGRSGKEKPADGL